MKECPFFGIKPSCTTIKSVEGQKYLVLALRRAITDDFDRFIIKANVGQECIVENSINKYPNLTEFEVIGPCGKCMCDVEGEIHIYGSQDFTGEIEI